MYLRGGGDLDVGGGREAAPDVHHGGGDVHGAVEVGRVATGGIGGVDVAGVAVDKERRHAELRLDELARLAHDVTRGEHVLGTVARAVDGKVPDRGDRLPGVSVATSGR